MLLSGRHRDLTESCRRRRSREQQEENDRRRRRREGGLSAHLERERERDFFCPLFRALFYWKEDAVVGICSDEKEERKDGA